MKYLLSLLSLLWVVSLSGQPHYEQLKQYQSELNAEFADPDTSPLSEEGLAEFERLHFFPIDSSYRVRAHLERTPHSKAFEMPTSTERKPLYRQYGQLTFELKGERFQIPIYVNLELMQKPGFERYLFLPFTDLTNGFDSYGGGRYLSAEIPEGDSLTLDFNKAYNPYCAYNYKYSCPIPPRENHLETEIRAGVMRYDGD